jgi:hypothetical protein
MLTLHHDDEDTESTSTCVPKVAPTRLWCVHVRMSECARVHACVPFEAGAPENVESERSGEAHPPPQED